MIADDYKSIAAAACKLGITSFPMGEKKKQTYQDKEKEKVEYLANNPDQGRKELDLRTREDCVKEINRAANMMGKVTIVKLPSSFSVVQTKDLTK